MFMESSKRCPFLQGEFHQKSFESQGIKFDFACLLRHILFNAFSDAPEKYGCLNGEYVQCRAYAERAFELSMSVPLTCPCKKIGEDQCVVTRQECDSYWIDLPDEEGEDYRRCEVFSQWFWSQKREPAVEDLKRKPEEHGTSS